MLIVAIMGIIVTLAVSLMNQKQKQQFVNWLKRLVTYPVYWYHYHRFWYYTRIYLAKGKQTDDQAYVYVGKRRKLLRDIHWKFSEWFGATRSMLKQTESIAPKVIDPDELEVIQVLAIYLS